MSLTLFDTGSSARFSPDGVYRYELRRRWADGPEVLWIMLNPSTADAENDDPTIRRCIGFSKRWGYGGLTVCNIFAYRATDPQVLLAVADPVGPDNDDAIRDAWARCRIAVAAWGVHGALMGRGDQIAALRPPVGSLGCLGTTQHGYPRHPLYVAGDTPLMPWR